MQSYDATTHFETTVHDVLAMYSRITGKVHLSRIMIVHVCPHLTVWQSISVSSSSFSSFRSEIHETRHYKGLDQV